MAFVVTVNKRESVEQIPYLPLPPPPPPPDWDMVMVKTTS